MDILHEVGLAQSDEGRNGRFTVTQAIGSGKWRNPSFKGEQLSPVNAHIFALMRSQMNLLICDKYFQACYNAKYAAGADDKGQVTITMDVSANDHFKVKVQEPQNEKVAGVAKRVQRERKTGVTRRYICITECLWHLLDLRFVFPSFHRVNIQTMEFESRVGFKFSDWSRRNPSSALPTSNVPLCATVRQSPALPTWR